MASLAVFDRIVVGYDDSAGARLALHAAIEFAKQTGGQITVVAVRPHVPYYGETASEVEEVYAGEEEMCRCWLAAAEAYAAEHGMCIHTEIRTGQAAQQLVRAANAHDADLLVVGQRSHLRMLGRFLLGTAIRTSRNAGCSVLIMRNADHAQRRQRGRPHITVSRG